MTVLTISEVVPAGRSVPALAGFELEQPEAGGSSDVFSLMLEGWVVGARAPAVRLDCMAPAGMISSLPINSSRPDLAARYPDLPWADRSGFNTGLSTVQLPARFEVRLDAVLADETSSPLAVVRGNRRPLPPATNAGPQPLIITTLGRSGSTWVTELLWHHPEVVSLHPYHYEPRVAAYWMEVLATLADPCSYSQILRPDSIGDDWWVGRHRGAPLPLGVDARVDEWLGRESVEDFARFCTGRIDSFYRGVIEPREYARASFFAEKFWPGSSVQTMLRELYPGASEVFLVRDFRDTASSVLAYSRQQGVLLFGRESVETDEDYIRGPLLDQARSLLESWSLRRDDSHLLRYEDLVLDPRGTLARLLSDLGIDAGGGAIDSMIGGPPEQRQGHQTAASAAASVGRWREDLSESMRRTCEEQLGEVLEAFGYT